MTTESVLKKRERDLLWKINNPEKYRESKRKYAIKWNAKQSEQRRVLREARMAEKARQKVPNPRSVSIEASGFKTNFYQIKTPIELCTECFKKYLVPLGCLWCNKHKWR